MHRDKFVRKQGKYFTTKVKNTRNEDDDEAQEAKPRRRKKLSTK